MSLKYHPDKNPDDPLASAKFLQVSKAQKCLTDPAAKENWEKYGNPDGPQTTKVGIGLPRFLLEKQHHLLILCLFFASFLVVIPAIFIVYYQRQKDYSPTGVLIETLQFMGHYINETTRLKNCPELVASSGESRKMEIRPEDDAEMKPVISEVFILLIHPNCVNENYSDFILMAARVEFTSLVTVAIRVVSAKIPL